jgi:hypothetical protein
LRFAARGTETLEVGSESVDGLRGWRRRGCLLVVIFVFVLCGTKGVGVTAAAACGLDLDGVGGL